MGPALQRCHTQSAFFGTQLQCHRAQLRQRVRQTTRAAKTSDGPSVAIVGVTGAVGQEFLRVSPAWRSSENLPAGNPNLSSWRQSGIDCHRCMHGAWSVSGNVWASQLHQLENIPFERFASHDLEYAQVLQQRDFPYSKIKLLASARCSPDHPGLLVIVTSASVQ